MDDFAKRVSEKVDAISEKIDRLVARLIKQKEEIVDLTDKVADLKTVNKKLSDKLREAEERLGSLTDHQHSYNVWYCGQVEDSTYFFYDHNRVFVSKESAEKTIEEAKRELPEIAISNNYDCMRIVMWEMPIYKGEIFPHNGLTHQAIQDLEWSKEDQRWFDHATAKYDGEEEELTESDERRFETVRTGNPWG